MFLSPISDFLSENLHFILIINQWVLYHEKIILYIKYWTLYLIGLLSFCSVEDFLEFPNYKMVLLQSPLMLDSCNMYS
jgi:hypothetical protein